METAFLIIGLILICAGLLKRAQRWEDHRLELEPLENERELSIFWGSDTATYDKEIALRIAELNDWKSKLKFESFFWCLLLLGGLSLALSAMIWLGEERNHTWSELGEIVIKFGGLVCLVLIFYWLNEKIQRADNQIARLKYMLKVVKDHAEDMRKASIDDHIELKARIDDLEKQL